MLGRDARGDASQGAQGASAGRSAAEREREERMKQLAAWRLQKEQQKRGSTPDKTLAASRSGKQPFNTMATSAQSDTERQRLLQRRKELMRAPSAKKAAQQPAKEARLPREEPRATSTASTATDADSFSSETTATEEIAASEQGEGRVTQTKPARSREDTTLEASVAAQPAAPESPTPTRLHEANEDTEKPATTRLEPAQHVASPLAHHRPPPEASPTRALPSFSPSKQSTKLIADSEHQQRGQSPPASAHHSPALYVPRPPPPRVVRLPDALVVDKRPPVRPTVSPSPPASVSSQTPPPNAQASPVGSPRSEPSVASFVLKTQPSPSKGAKQVRFADQLHALPEHIPVHGSSPLMEQRNEASESVDGHGEAADIEPHNHLQDSQSSVDREIQQTEVLMSEVDELLSFHKMETIVTDHLVHLHRDSHGEEVVEKEIVETRTEETSLVHIEEETIVDAPAVAAENQIPPPSEPDVSHPDAGSPPQPIQANPGDHNEKTPPASEHSDINHESPKLYAARPPVASAAGETALPTPAPHVPQQREQATRTASKRSRITVCAAVELSLVVICVALLDHFYPWSPVSKGIRVAIRATGAVTSYLTACVADWMWKNVLRPTTESTCARLADADAIWSPSARALQSLVRGGCEGLSSMLRGDRKLSMSYDGHAIFKSISSRVADAFMYVARPLLNPLPKIDPATTKVVEHRLEELNDAQAQLEVKVKEILRTQEEWALEELERMKLRRVTYAAATKSILRETSRTMLEAVREAKLAAAEHIETFTNQLASALMVSIQPNLEEYGRSQADASREHAQLDADLKKERLEAAARVEILRIEVARKQAAANLGEDVLSAREHLVSDVVAEEVDLMEVVETAEEVIGGDAVRAVEEIEASFEATVGEAARIAKEKEAKINAAAVATEFDIEIMTKQVLEKLQEDVSARKEELRLKHDAVKDEIRRAASLKLEILEAELLAAEELARERLRAEESVLQDVAEAQRALDELFLEDAELLDRELVTAAEAASSVEVEEVEQVVAASEQVEKDLETQVVKEVEVLVAGIHETESEIVGSVDAAEAKLGDLEVAVEEAIEAIAMQEMELQEAERVLANAAIDDVAAQVEQAIAASVGVQKPSDLLSRDNTNAVRPAKAPVETSPVPVAGKIYDETEVLHMVLLSIGFVVLAFVTAFVLYPRYVRLAVAPAKDPKQWTMDRRRRRRRRSWQRPAHLTDSEVEEVILLQTGSSSDDGLSDSNEPEPEVVEFMSGASETPDRSWQQSTTTTTTTTSTSSYSRQLAVENERLEAAQQGEEEQASDTPQRRELRRRTRRAQ